MKSDSQIFSTHEIADQYLLWGLSVVPVKHRTKAPSIDWKPFQTEQASQAKIDKWFHQKDIGLGVVCGPVSGGLVCIDFHTKGSYEAFTDQNPSTVRFPTAASHRGKHVFFRSVEPVNSGALYMDGIDGKAGDIISNRKFVVLPPTMHPEGFVREWLVPLTRDIPVVQLQRLQLRHAKQEENVFLTNEFHVGKRHTSLMRMALEFADLDALSMEAIEEVIHQTNRVRCKPPLPEDEVEGILRNVAEKRGGVIGMPPRRQ